MNKLSPADLDKMSKAPSDKPKDWIKVGLSSCGIAAGADEVFNFFVEEVKKRNLQIEIKKCGCAGMCYAEPLVEVNVEGLPSVIYGSVNKDIATKILEKHVISKMLVNDYIFEVLI
ncbi:MAG: (2Fe-2S) ferredoxin domain-containing protein [Candidatus Omnitrophica bacterium]|jgi:(2Fe-2S) ferredoxin|nr:(2Fe-2S) ferredoxin domain-containing protein [Candidatus Omnitrophota bacterium]MDD5690346.1 (2Fe-2S) ferredoxin domain-containing protein [Candidatus Omnitrophota bacterium]